MIVLPSSAFRFSGEDGVMELTLEEVLGFPDEPGYRGEYDARGQLTIQAGAYSVLAGKYYFSLDDLRQFLAQLEACHAGLSDTAAYSDMSEDLSFRLAFNRLGHVSLEGRFQDIPSINNILSFSFHSDQTQSRESAASMRKILSQFSPK